jgi:hypothetical protein
VPPAPRRYGYCRSFSSPDNHQAILARESRTLFFPGFRTRLLSIPGLMGRRQVAQDGLVPLSFRGTKHRGAGRREGAPAPRNDELAQNIFPYLLLRASLYGLFSPDPASLRGRASSSSAPARESIINPTLYIHPSPSRPATSRASSCVRPSVDIHRDHDPWTCIAAIC